MQMITETIICVLTEIHLLWVAILLKERKEEKEDKSTYFGYMGLKCSISNFFCWHF